MADIIVMYVFIDAGVRLAAARPAVRQPACPLRRPAPPSSLPTALRSAPVLSASTPGQTDTQHTINPCGAFDCELLSTTLNGYGNIKIPNRV